MHMAEHDRTAPAPVAELYLVVWGFKGPRTDDAFFGLGSLHRGVKVRASPFEGAADTFAT